MKASRKKQLGIIAGLLILGCVWAFLIVPYLTSQTWFLTLHPLAAYLLYNLGWILLVSVIFGGLISLAVAKENRMLSMFRVGLASWTGFSFVFDMLQPPLYLSTSGQVLIPMGTASLENVSVDGMTATIWQQLLSLLQINLVGSWWWFVLTYVVTLIVAVLFMAAVLTPKSFVKMFGRT
jgi:hypothetical protein